LRQGRRIVEVGTAGFDDFVTLKATMPLDAIRVLLNESELAESFSYTVVDLGGLASDVTTAITGLFDPSVDEIDGSTISTALEVLIANGTISRVAMATDAAGGIFEQGEALAGGTSGATGEYVGQAAGILYFKPLIGTFVADEVVTGGTSGSTWTTNLTPDVSVEGIASPKAGDRFLARGFNWQVDTVDDEKVAGSHLIGARRADVPAV